MFEEIAHGRNQGRFSFLPFSDCFQRNRSRARRREAVMPLKIAGTIAIPGAAGSEFDHAAFDANSRRVFIAHTARDCVEVIDHDARRHIATLPGFPGVAGAVADDGQILVTNRGSASIALLDAGTLKTHATFKTGARPNGAVIVARSGLAIAACIGDEKEAPTLQLFGLSDHRHVSIDLPGRPRWCVTDAAAERLFLCIREPSMVLVARLPDLGVVAPTVSTLIIPEVGFMSPAMTRPWSRWAAPRAKSPISGRSRGRPMSPSSTRQPVSFTSPSGSPGLSKPLIRAPAMAREP
jgi:YVTN family beta-propeller protein